MHFKIRVAELNIAVSARYALTERICRPYLCDASDRRLDFSIYATGAQILAKQREIPTGISEEIAECICLHEQLALRLLPYDAFVLHAALLCLRGQGYAVCAPRGVGKTTHVRMWQQLYGDDVRVINGDKPIVRRQKDGTFMAYGTPWCGKEGEGENAGVPLKGICLLSRGEQNRVQTAISEEEYVRGVIGQTVFPPNRATMDRSARLLAAFVRTVPAVTAACRMDVEAARMVSESLLAIKKG